MAKQLVCHISFNHSPLDDRIYWKELLTLQKAGYSVIHIAVAKENDDYITAEGIRIIAVKRKQFFKNVWLNKAFQALFKNKGTIHDIFKVASNLNAAIYHYHDLQINAIAADLKELAHQPKIIYDSHEAYHLLIRQRSTEASISYLIRKMAAVFITPWEVRQAAICDYIIVTDHYTYEYFRNRLPHIQSKIIHNYSYFPPIKVSLTKKKYDLIYSGQLSNSRGIREIIYSVLLCKKCFPTISALLVGEFDSPSFKTEIEKLIKQLSLSEHITVKAAVPFQEIEKFYGAAKIGLCLLHETPKFKTAIPIKLFEYMAFGLPVIASSHGITAKIVRESYCGLLVDPLNVESIAEAIIRLLKNTELYSTQSTNGLISISKKYNWECESKKLLETYSELLN